MATVYDKSSLFLAPSGVSNGTVFVQKPVPIYGSEQVTNGDFSQTGAEEVRNGDFSDGTYWSTPTGWSINNGTLQGTNVNAISATQSGFSFLNKSFRVEYTITEISQGDIKVYLGGSQSTPQRSAVGTYVEYIDITSANATLYIQGINNFTGKIDNVSVKELGQDWTLGTGWSIGEDKAVHTGTQSLIGKSNILTIGKTYKITFDLSGADGSNYARLLQSQYPNGGNYTSNGTISVHTIANIDDLYIYGVGDISITNISVQEVLSPAGDFTFTRGSNLSATRVNEAQLIEKGRENLLLQSNQFDTTPWVPSNATLISGQSGYDTTFNAWKLESTNTSASFVKQDVAQSGVSTSSIYLKAGNANFVYFRVGGATSQGGFINLTDGSVSNLLNSPIEIKATSVGNGWFRCVVVANTSVTNIRYYVSDVVGSTSSDTGSYIYIQDAQLEQGLVATSVITTGAVPAQAGLLENTPRLDYSGGATCPSLLLEPSRTNLVTQSEYFGNAFWNKFNVIAELIDFASPDGQNNSYKITETTSNAQHAIAVGSSNRPTLSAGSHTHSCFVRANGVNDIVVYNNGGSGGAGVNIDLSDGTYSNLSGSATSASVEPFANNWYRISLTFTALAGSSALSIYLRTLSSYVGDGTSGVYLYGAQMEAGGYPTSYIPTYGTSQTRAKDVCGDAGDAATFNSTEGVLYAEIAALAEDSDSKRITISDGTLANRITLSISDNIVSGFINVNNVTQYTFFESGQDVVNPIKIAVKYKANDFAIWINGVEYDASTSGNTFSSGALSQLSFDNASGVNNFYGNVKQLIYFPKALSDLQLAILTGATTYETFDEMALALNYTVYE